jgi:hypothetical protein
MDIQNNGYYTISDDINELYKSTSILKIFKPKKGVWFNLEMLSNMNIYLVETEEQLIELLSYFSKNVEL